MPRHGFHFVPTEDASTTFEFDGSGRHTRTISGSNGTELLTFGYDATTHQLTSITDASGNVTSVDREDDLITITAPHGQKTRLALDENGYLATVTNPNGETTHLSHTETGMLTDLVDPRAGAHHFEYDEIGRLTKDTNATPGSPGTQLAAKTDRNGWEVNVTSPEGRATTYRTDQRGDFGDTAIVERRTISQDSLSTIMQRKRDNSVSTESPDGTKVTVLETAADPRWGTAASYNKTVQTDIGFPTTTHSMIRKEDRAATLAIAEDPFSVTQETHTMTLSADGLPNSVTTSVYSAGPPATVTTTSATGRKTRQTLDALERVTQVELLGTDPAAIYPTQIQYDAKGRIAQVTQGSRTYTTTYNSTTGWVASTTDPADLGVSYASRDGNGRPLSIELPGGRTLAMSYDANGNLVSVMPPEKPEHEFSWDLANQMDVYAPPELGFAPKNTTYAYDYDGLLTSLLQPDKPTTYAYDTIGRVTKVSSHDNTAFAYDPQGRLSTITTSDGVVLTNSYDGSLLVQQALSGPFAHAINRAYDNFLRRTSWDVDGVDPVVLAYDADGLITSAAGMSVSRGNNGLLKSTSVGVVTDTFQYNGYGETVGHTSAGYAATYTRDAAGRIEEKSETIGGVTRSERYTYDAAGRLWQVFVNGGVNPDHEWTYDANGNRSDGVVDGQDRLLSNDLWEYTYDANGDLSSKTNKVTSAETRFVYDAQGNLRSVARPVPELPIEYVIDGANRRIGKKNNGELVQGFLYDGSRIVAELDGAGAVVSLETCE
jgi:YD repeat-containing protein